MEQICLVDIIKDQTERALWEVNNVIDCIPDELWNKEYCEMPCWKHVYHMLHSLDRWYINPRDITYMEPSIHVEHLDNLDIPTDNILSRDEIMQYYEAIKVKINTYITSLQDSQLLEFPKECEYTKFTLILGQFRHLHSHMGMIMGFIIDDTGLWPRVLGLEHPIPMNDYSKYL